MRCMFWITQAWLFVGCMTTKTTDVAPVTTRSTKQPVITPSNTSVNNVDDSLLVFGALLTGVVLCVVLVNLLNRRKQS